jgi:DNA-binding CsgD family transcriptional regulator
MTGTGRLAGRDEELACIGERLASVKAGHGEVVVLEGAAGYGKTRLLQETVAIARRMGIRSGAGAARESHRLAPVMPLIEALFDGEEPLLDPAGLQQTDLMLTPRYWLIQELQNQLEQAAIDGPLLVCLDDVQWADGGTIEALRTLPVSLGGLPIGWLLTCRPAEAPRLLRRSVRTLEALGATTLPLSGLDEGAVATLATEAFGAPPAPELLRQLARADGNPFLLTQLLTGLAEERLVAVDGGLAQLTGDQLPERLRWTLVDRLDRLSPTARHVVGVASALGRRFTIRYLAAMLTSSPSELLPTVEELLAADLLAEDAAGLTFRHDLIREAVLESMPRPALRALERQAAGVLLDAGVPPVEIARLLLDSAEPGDELAIRALAEAARALGTSDPEAAADIARGALALTAPRDPLRASLVADTAILLHGAGRVAEGQAFAQAALRDVLPPEAEAEVCLSIAAMLALSPDVRAEMGERALSLVGVPEPLRARHLAALAHNRVAGGRTREAHAVRERAVPLVQEHGDLTARFTLGLSAAALDYVDGRPGDALAVLEATMRERHRATDEARARMTGQWRSELLVALDRPAEAIEAITTAGVQAAQDRQAWAVRWFESSRGRYLFQVGQLGDAAAALEGLLRANDDAVELSVVDVAGLVALGRVALHLGDARLTGETAALARPVLDTTVPGLRRHAAWLLALQAMARSDAGGAHAILMSLGADAEESVLPLYPMDVTDPPQLVRIALAAGDDALAEATTATAAARAARNAGVRTMHGAAEHCAGLLARDAGRLVRAAETLADAPRPLALASALEDAGHALAAAGRQEDAVAQLSRALEVYAEAGATWDAGRVRGRLRALGVNRRAARSTGPRTGWAGLTESELAVARLVASGLTNREVAERLFVSPHTVSMHLRHAFAKLEVSSRVELTRIAVAAGDAGPAEGPGPPGS